MRGKKDFPSTMVWNSQVAKTDLEKACLFNDYFSSVFQDKLSDALPVSNVDQFICLDDVSFTVCEVEHLLNKAPDSNTLSTDNLSPGILRAGAKVLAPLIHILFSLIISSAILPSACKSAIITPLFKADSVSCVCNYRPISLLPRLSLIFERILFDFIYVRVKDQLSNSQHGFRSKRSTVTQLICYCDKIYMLKDSNLPVAMCLL